MQSKVEAARENRDLKEGNVPEKLKDKVEAELEDYENQQAMEQVFLHEENLRREREEEKKRLKWEEYKRIRAEQDLANKEVLKEHKKVERQLQREKEKFEELLRVTRINDVNAVLDQKTFLVKNKQNLEKFQQEYLQRIQADKEQIAALEKERKALIYEQKEGQTDDSLLNKLEELEKTLQHEQEYSKEISKKISKKQMCLDQMCLSISRIIFQINSKSAQNSSLLGFSGNSKLINSEVKREDLEEKINNCSLILERIHSILSKNNIDNIKVESVNTDFNNEAPPRYLGISSHRVQPNLENLDQALAEQDIMNDDSQNIGEVRELLKSQ